MMELIKRHRDVYYIGGRNLRLHRQAAGMSQRQLAAKIKELTGIETDHRRISEKESAFEFECDLDFVQALQKIFINSGF